MLDNAKMYARLREEQFSLFESYARKRGMNSKSLLVFMWIYYSPVSLTQEEIAKRTHSTKQVIQAIIKTYKEKGVLELLPSREDRRKKLVALTKNGRDFSRRLLQPLAEYEQEAMAALTREQQEALLEGTRLFSEKLNELMQ